MNISPATLFTLQLHSSTPPSPLPSQVLPATAPAAFSTAPSTAPPNPTPAIVSPKSVTHPLLSHLQSSFETLRALCDAPFIQPYNPTQPFLISAEQFFEDNHLIAATLKPSTQQKYARALHNFAISDAACDEAPLSLDHRLCIYIHDRFHQNSKPGQRQEMSNLICMLLIMYPTLREQLGLARRCVSGWKALTPAKAAAPLSRQLVRAFAWHLLLTKRPQSATILLLSFSGCLRVSEALRLTWQHVALPGDTRLSSYQPGIAGINILDAKTARYSGELQFVQLTDSDTIRYLCTLNRRQHRPDDKVADISYQTYTDHLKYTATQFGFPDSIFTSHSARIGKATEDFIQGQPVDSIALHGRWKSINSLRYYINNGRAWLLKNELSSAHQDDIRLAEQQFSALIDNTNTPPPQ